MPIRRSAAAPPKEDTPPAPAPEPGMNRTFSRSLSLHSHSGATGEYTLSTYVCEREFIYKIHTVGLEVMPRIKKE